MADRYASPTGSGTAATLAAPSALADVFANTNGVTINPGDVVRILAGTYTGSFNQTVNGTASAPVIYQAAPNQRVIIDGSGLATGSGAIIPTGNFVWYWDLEILNSDTANRATKRPDNIHGNVGSGPLKFINCVIHDSPQNGYLVGAGVSSVEINGCLFYYNGIFNSNQAHNMYFAQLSTATQRVIRNNIMFDSAGYSFHGFADGDGHYSLNFEFNSSFQGGFLSGNGARNGANYLIGITTNSPVGIPNHVRIANNLAYSILAGNTGSDMQLGYQWGMSDCQFNNNRMVGIDFRWDGMMGQGIQMTGNNIEGNMFQDGTAHLPTSAGWPGNTFTDDGSHPSSGKEIFRTATDYEPGRGHITILNWDQSNTVAVDISQDDRGRPIVRSGDNYAVYWAPYFNVKTPCLTGTYAGGTVAIPMTAGVLGAMPNPFDPAMLQPPTTTLPLAGQFIVQTTRHVT